MRLRVIKSRVSGENEKIELSRIVVFQTMRENGLMTVRPLMSQESNLQPIVKQRKRVGGSFGNRA